MESKYKSIPKNYNYKNKFLWLKHEGKLQFLFIPSYVELINIFRHYDKLFPYHTKYG